LHKKRLLPRKQYQLALFMQLLALSMLIRRIKMSRFGASKLWQL